MNKGLFIVLSGPSGSGKDTVLSKLKERNLNLKQSISMTTRPMRPGETDGVDYFFADTKTFEQNIENDFFLEYVKYGDNYYGTPKAGVEILTQQGYNAVLKIEVEGAGNVRKLVPEAISIFLIPPSLQVLWDRLNGRGTESVDVIKKRFEIAKEELKRASEYDFVVVNDDIDDCVDDVCAIIISESSRYTEMKEFVDDLLTQEIIE